MYRIALVIAAIIALWEGAALIYFGYVEVDEVRMTGGTIIFFMGVLILGINLLLGKLEIIAENTQHTKERTLPPLSERL